MNNLKITKLILSLLLVPAMLMLAGCASNTPATVYDDQLGDNLNVSFTIISQGALSNISLPNQLVIKNTTDWQRLLKIHGNTPKSTKTTIDFADKIVIAIFAGQQPTGGYSVGVTNIKRVDNNLYVTVTFTEPKANETVSLALTQPYIFISTNKVNGKIIFLAPPTVTNSN